VEWFTASYRGVKSGRKSERGQYKVYRKQKHGGRERPSTRRTEKIIIRSQEIRIYKEFGIEEQQVTYPKRTDQTRKEQIKRI